MPGQSGVFCPIAAIAYCAQLNVTTIFPWRFWSATYWSAETGYSSRCTGMSDRRVYSCPPAIANANAIVAAKDHFQNRGIGSVDGDSSFKTPHRRSAESICGAIQNPNAIAKNGM